MFSSWDYTMEKVFPLSFFDNAFFLLSTSLISCIPYFSIHNFFLLLGMKALEFHMFSFDEIHDLVMIPIFLPLTTWRKKNHSCYRQTSTSTISDCYCWIIFYRLHSIIHDLIATLCVFCKMDLCCVKRWTFIIIFLQTVAYGSNNPFSNSLPKPLKFDDVIQAMATLHWCCYGTPTSFWRCEQWHCKEASSFVQGHRNKRMSKLLKISKFKCLVFKLITYHQL